MVVLPLLSQIPKTSVIALLLELLVQSDDDALATLALTKPPDDSIQATSQDARLMRGTLKAVGGMPLLGVCFSYILWYRRFTTPLS